MSVFGTRPEVIKMAPVIAELQRRSDVFDSTVVVTGQHREMCDPYIRMFEIHRDRDLGIMRANQTLDSIVAAIATALPPVITEFAPDIVLVQGDTSSAFVAALAAFHAKVKVGHIEAGLRTHNKLNPFPEEMNRTLIGRIADFHFAPTPTARDNLVREGVCADLIHVTGNTSIDALKMTVERARRAGCSALAALPLQGGRLVVLTTHRRESLGEPMRNTLTAIRRLVVDHPDIEVIFPVHYNPNVRAAVDSILKGVERVYLIEPLDYLDFVHLLDRAYLVLTDSGGIQEEAPSLGKPVLVLRDTTERPEGVVAGTARLVGTDIERVMAAAHELLTNTESYRRMATAANPYGDGTAAREIVDVIAASCGRN